MDELFFLIEKGGDDGEGAWQTLPSPLQRKMAPIVFKWARSLSFVSFIVSLLFDLVPK